MPNSNKPRISINSPKWGETTKHEFEAITGRAAAFSAKATSELFDKDGNAANAEWIKILADLDAWAAKHKVGLGTSEHESYALQAPGGGAVTRSECPSLTSSIETVEFAGTNQKYKVRHTCLLRRQTLLGRCVYSCTSEQV